MLFTLFICTKILGGKNTLFSLSDNRLWKFFFNNADCRLLAFGFWPLAFGLWLLTFSF
jgi:hypothetical protein